jgi:hypothetical protein
MKDDMNTNTDMATVEKNCRLITDRRKCPTPIISRYTFHGGRRKTVRREREKSKYIYVDLYSTRLLIAAITLLLLSCLDAYLTIELIGKGHVVEANPVMAFFLDYGTTPFTVVKFVATAFCLIILCLFKNVKITRICLPVAIKMYVIVIAYEFYLFMI